MADDEKAGDEKSEDNTSILDKITASISHTSPETVKELLGSLVKETAEGGTLSWQAILLPVLKQP